MTLPILLLVARAFACPSLGAALDTAVAHSLAADFTAAERDLADAEAALACAEATPAEIAHYLVIRGGVAEFVSPGSGARLFASARAIDPAAWDPRLGPAIEQAWASAKLEGEGSLALDTNQDGGRVDGGVVAAWPAKVPEGWHVVQVVSLDGRAVLFGKAVNLPAGEAALVQTGLAEGLAATPQPLADSGRKRVLSPAWVIASGVVAAAGGGLAIGARLQADRIDAYEEVETLDTAWTREQQLAYGAYAAWGTAGALFGLSFVFR